MGRNFQQYGRTSTIRKTSRVRESATLHNASIWTVHHDCNVTWWSIRCRVTFLQGGLLHPNICHYFIKFHAHQVCLVDTGPGPNQINKGFLTPAWKEPLKAIRLPPLRTETCKFLSIDWIVLLFVHTGDLLMRARLGVVENLAVDLLLRTLLIDFCICERFLPNWKMVLGHSAPVPIISTQKTVNEIAPKIEEVNILTIINRCISTEGHYLSGVAHEVTVFAYSQAAVLVSCSGAGLTKHWVDNLNQSISFPEKNAYCIWSIHFRNIFQVIAFSERIGFQFHSMLLKLGKELCTWLTVWSILLPKHIEVWFA